MQFMFRTVRLFQMSSMTSRFLLLLFGLFVLNACSGDSEGANASGQEEKLPKVKTSDFKTIERKGFEFQLYKMMSLNRADGREILNADLLTKEFHLSVEEFSLKSFLKEEGFPKNDAKKLEWFAEKHSVEFEQKLISLVVNPLEKVTVNEQPCFKKVISGRSFGFPKDKEIFLRYYQFDKKFIAVIGWTVKENASKFKPIVNYMGMMVKPIED